MVASLATVYSRARRGLDAPPVTCEVQLAGGLPRLTIVGLVETAVKESKERVKAAISESGYDFPDGRVTVNLAPADLPKTGGWFDLAIALGILIASGQVPGGRAADYELYGELSFAGELRAVPGLLPALVKAGQSGRSCIIPVACQATAGLIDNLGTRVAGHLVDVVNFFAGQKNLQPCPGVQWPPDPCAVPDLCDVHGQHRGRRALEIAAAGRHHLLMIGSPGTGKTMLAQRLAGLLPRLNKTEVIETILVQSLTARERPVISRQQPLRAPHHSASAVAMVGGGRPPRPGEISLAHNGILFMDELPEFNRTALEALREPLENGVVTVSRAEHTATFPARFQLIAAMNPCPCGFAGDKRKDCRCTPGQVQRYRGRISGPFLDRIDIRVELSREEKAIAGRLGQSSSVDGDALLNESSKTVRNRVLQARRIQESRQGSLNAGLFGDELIRHCRPDTPGRELLTDAAEKFVMSARACDACLKVARTIADLAQSEQVRRPHIAEALSFRQDTD